MGRYTALNDSLVDATVEGHMKSIVAEIKSQMNPDSIILRGSFGRGEGSISNQNNKLQFLSDYEIDVAISSPIYRSLLRKLSRKFSLVLGVETSLRWVRPDYLYRNRVGPFPMGPAPITISLYESRYGSRTLDGEEIISTSPEINPAQILPTSAAQLILNRMAEVLYYFPRSDSKQPKDLVMYYWINKTILACAESLLLLWGHFHYSYQERGRRFKNWGTSHLNFMGNKKQDLFDMVERATEYKLRPRDDVYQDSVQETWSQMVPILDQVFRQLSKEIYGISFSNYVEFPEKYLLLASENFKTQSPTHKLTLKMLDVYKSTRYRNLPSGIHLPYNTSQIVYSIIPLLFVGSTEIGDNFSGLLSEVRTKLTLITPIERQKNDLYAEWNTLRDYGFKAWKNYCVL